MRCPSLECPDFILDGKHGEYAEGILVCSRCGATLVGAEEGPTTESQVWESAVAEEEGGELVEVGRFLQRHDGELVAEFLKAYGIAAVTTADDCGAVYAGVAPGRVRVLAPAADAGAARELLRRAEAGELVLDSSEA